MARAPSTWAIGDIHGRQQTLEALLARLDFDLTLDRLWLVGDLVNRGPDSLGVLRWARQIEQTLGARFACVLGNHDIHLLATAAGLRQPNDDLRQVLEAADAPRLISWLRHRPLLVSDGERLLLHAGLWPHWSLEDAEESARLLEYRLQDDAVPLADSLRSLLWRQRASNDELRSALYAFTALRLLDAEGQPSPFKGPPEQAPAGHIPWFAAPARGSRELEIVCGHWAALGLRLQTGLIALDSGVAWGGSLSAVRLEDREVVQQENLDLAAT